VAFALSLTGVGRESAPSPADVEDHVRAGSAG
jgi:hypothetical protein